MERIILSGAPRGADGAGDPSSERYRPPARPVQIGRTSLLLVQIGRTSLSFGSSMTSATSPPTELVAHRRGASLPPPPPSRTDWTRLVPPPVLTGHVSDGAERRSAGSARARAAIFGGGAPVLSSAAAAVGGAAVFGGAVARNRRTKRHHRKSADEARLGDAEDSVTLGRGARVTPEPGSDGSARCAPARARSAPGRVPPRSGRSRAPSRVDFARQLCAATLRGNFVPAGRGRVRGASLARGVPRVASA
jgi:hypothetical protein